jgi:DNA-binding CsgD family transcriptional regulator
MVFTHRSSSALAFSLSLGLGLLGCGAEGPADLGSEAVGEAAEAAHGCDVGGTDIDARGSFSCDFSLPGNLPINEVPPLIERDRMYMAERPGMIHKQLPLAIDTSTGNLFSGGRYLFKTEDQAKDYAEWVRHGFFLDGTEFLDRPIFLAPECHSWSVIGAHEFAPIETSQLVMRTERFATPPGNRRSSLEHGWQTVLTEAHQRGLTAVWLVYNRDERLAQLVYFADRVGPSDPTTPDFASLGALEGAAPLGDTLGDLGWPRTFDRAEWVLTIWFPFKPGDHGKASIWPYSPPLPQPFCGDGVCEPSRGETPASCAADCGASCGDAVARHRLTRAETDVLRALARGLANQEIAGGLFVSVETVRTHVRRVLAKLGVPTRARAAVLVRDLVG